MREVNLRSIDLNLLVVLDALLDHCHVSNAASAAGMSQPAMSRALGRLRDVIGDPLLVRSDEGLAMTPTAAALQPKLKEVLSGIRGLVASRDFDPLLWRGHTTIASTDNQTTLLLPRIISRLSRQAPFLDVNVVPMTSATTDLMLRGEIDLGFGVVGSSITNPLIAEPLYKDHFVSLLRKDHPGLQDWGLERFLALNHVLVTIIGSGPVALDQALEKLGRCRRIALKLPHFFAAISIVAQSDMVVSLPVSVARRFADENGLVILETPVETPTVEIAAFWPPVMDAEPSHQWLRSVVRSAANELASMTSAHSPTRQTVE